MVKDGPSETPTFERLFEYTRPGGQLHDQTCALMEESLYRAPFSDNQLVELSKTGEYGLLAAIALSVSYGRRLRPVVEEIEKDLASFFLSRKVVCRQSSMKSR
jgi:hypothetical protein